MAGLLLSNSGLLLGIWETPASPGWICASMSASPHRVGTPISWLPWNWWSLLSLLKFVSVCVVFADKRAVSILIKSTECWAKGGYHFHRPTIYHSVNSSRLDFFAVRAYQTAHAPLLPIKITRLFSRKLHCRQYSYTGFLFPRTLCFSPLNLTHFLLAHFSRLSRSLQRAVLSPGFLTHSLVWCHLQTLWSSIPLPPPGRKADRT